MSRSLWAWTEGRALAGAALRSARKWAQRGHHQRGDSHSTLGLALPTFYRPMLVVATAVLALGMLPAPALAQTRHTGANQTRSNIRGDRHTVKRSLRSRADGRSIRPALVGDLVLPPGAGFDSAHGSPLVRALQRRLVTAGDPPGPIDGLYGPLTEQAVRRFQAAHGLVVDGIAGPVTIAALTSPTPVLYPGAGYGAVGGSAAVRSLQRHLRRLGDSPGPIDGLYGPRTTMAVERFQRSHGLRVDGIVGSRTGHAVWRVSLARSARRLTRHHAPRVRRPAPPTPPSPQIPKPVAAPRAPALPVTMILVAIAALGLVTAARSYRRTRTKIRRARTSARLEAVARMPSVWPKQPPRPTSQPSPRPKRAPVRSVLGSDEGAGR